MPAQISVPSQLFVLLGAPGAGKGTQGACLASMLGSPHVSVGDLVRNLQAAGARVPRDRRTRLVDTDFTVDLIVRAASGAGQLVLDGFPRTSCQVQAFVSLPWPAKRVLWLDIPFSVAIDRMRARGRHGENLAQISFRHLNHEQAAAPLHEALTSAGVQVARVDGTGTVEQVHQRVLTNIHNCCG